MCAGDASQILAGSHAHPPGLLLFEAGSHQGARPGLLPWNPLTQVPRALGPQGCTHLVMIPFLSKRLSHFIRFLGNGAGGGENNQNEQKSKEASFLNEVSHRKSLESGPVTSHGLHLVAEGPKTRSEVSRRNLRKSTWLHALCFAVYANSSPKKSNGAERDVLAGG